MRMRSKKALANISVALVLQIVAIACGLILPRLIISTYGSDVNGLINSITQFLGYIVLLEAGVGGVVRAALYKPLASSNINSISGIIKATERFFKIVAYMFIGYLLIIALMFPYLVGDNFDRLFTITLVLIIGISTFFQYYLGISYQILLQADQKSYVTSVVQIITLLLNTALVVILVNLDASIHMVKLGSAVVFVIRPLLLNFYVHRKYKIIKECKPDNNAIKQRWDGLGHHIAFLLHTNTDIALLTIFANIKEVSVYSIYYLVVSSIKKITATFSSGLEAAFGNMIAKNEKEVLNRNFRIFEFSSFTITTVLFTSTALLILPFISLYTSGITDADYYRPTFAYTLIAAEAIFCIRIPYNAVVLAAGHYKQTRNGAILEAIINIILSLILVNFLGIIGVAIGTLCAMLFRTIQYAVYLSKNILKRSIWIFVKKTMVYALSSVVTILVIKLLPVFTLDSYISWFIYGIEVVVIASIVTLLTGTIFYYKDMKEIILIAKRMFYKKKSKNI
ncbi:polysaccharide biosynthesis C-terminal domain-containing protein [Bacillus sp. HNR-4]|nr:polysaccharide biosynthesis C-terminal domain-containing protein [Bacillus sp. HNR-4]